DVPAGSRWRSAGAHLRFPEIGQNGRPLDAPVLFRLPTHARYRVAAARLAPVARPATGDVRLAAPATIEGARGNRIIGSARVDSDSASDLITVTPPYDPATPLRPFHRGDLPAASAPQAKRPRRSGAG